MNNAQTNKQQPKLLKMSNLTAKSPEECISLLITANGNDEVNAILKGCLKHKQENGESFSWATHVGNSQWYFPLQCEWVERRESAIRIAQQYTK